MEEEGRVTQMDSQLVSREPGRRAFNDPIHCEPLSGRNVLVLEDDALTASHLAYSISRSGGNVVGPAMCNAEAEDILLTSLVELAILDVDLVGETSFAIAERLIEENIPFVFHSATDPVKVQAKFPGVPFLQKGILHHCLIGRLAQHAQAARPTKTAGVVRSPTEALAQ